MENEKPDDLIPEKKFDWEEYVRKSREEYVNSYYKPKSPVVRIKKLDEELPTPHYQTEGSAGFDLYCTEFTILLSGKPTLVPTGIAIALEPGWEAQIRPRSGLALKNGITVLNSPGTIDSDYRGEIKVILVSTTGSHSFNRGDRIAQMVIKPAPQAKIKVVEDLDETDRGEGGFGSTGK